MRITHFSGIAALCALIAVGLDAPVSASARPTVTSSGGSVILQSPSASDLLATANPSVLPPTGGTFQLQASASNPSIVIAALDAVITMPDGTLDTTSLQASTQTGQAGLWVGAYSLPTNTGSEAKKYTVQLLGRDRAGNVLQSDFLTVTVNSNSSGNPETIFMEQPTVDPASLPSTGGTAALRVNARDTNGLLTSVNALVKGPDGTVATIPLTLIPGGSPASGSWSGVFTAPSNPTALDQVYQVVYSGKNSAGKEGRSTAAFLTVKASLSSLLPASQRNTLETYLVPVSAGGNQGLYLYLHIKHVAGQPETSTTLHLTAPDGNEIATEPLSLSEEPETFIWHSLAAPLAQGTYTATYPFDDATITQPVSPGTGDASLTASMPQLIAPGDGSLRVQWNAVPNGQSYFLDLWMQEDDSFQRIGGILAAGDVTDWSLPSDTLLEGKQYTLDLYTLNFNFQASPLTGNLSGLLVSTPNFTRGHAPGSLVGDINGDGRVNVQDATLALRASVGLETLTTEQITAADTNGDGKVNVQDATSILRKAVGL